MELKLLLASSYCDGSFLPFSAGCQCYTWPQLPERVLLPESTEIFKELSSKQVAFPHKAAA